MKSSLCLALDTTDARRALDLVESTRAYVGTYKIGATTFAALGPGFVSEVSSRAPVFVDLKLHDIPAQVAGAVEAVAGLGATYLTVHASGGRRMIDAAVAAAPEELKILAVTVLTSLDDHSLADIGIAGSAQATALRLGELAVAGGASGLVCSSLEVSALRARFGPSDAAGPLLVVPGVRLPGADRQDQMRARSPAEAMAASADMLVVGRPITSATDPAAAARAILEGLMTP